MTRLQLAYRQKAISIKWRLDWRKIIELENSSILHERDMIWIRRRRYTKMIRQHDMEKAQLRTEYQGNEDSHPRVYCG